MTIYTTNLHEIRDSLILKFILKSKSENLLPKNALAREGIEVHSSVPNRWDAFDLESLCSFNFKKENDQ